MCVVGLGYVGLPLASLLSRKFKVHGYDSNKEKIAKLRQGIDPTGEVGDLKECAVQFSADPAVIAKASFIIIAVPTPVTVNNVPDFSFVEQASAMVGKYLQRGAMVVYESTVHPGCTEDICLPILERESGFTADKDFQLGYSPERVNPGDREHAIDRIVKIVAGRDAAALERIAAVYGQITTVYRAPGIKVAEAAKVVENIQRDVNIALMNELALVFDKLGLDTRDVIAAAATKWNFQRFTPGLVGGHCIAVDPYYLVHEALRKGLEPKLILGAREINNYMPKFIVRQVVTMLHAAGRGIGDAMVLMLGLTFKENVNDTRNSRAFELVEGFAKLKAKVYAYDPLLTEQELSHHPGIAGVADPRKTALRFDAVVVVSPHRVFLELPPSKLAAVCRRSRNPHRSAATFPVPLGRSDEI
ncbi:MAG: nucleotide sugar dehydrogenase [Parcubacteria group bacterium Gr01-1014_31]|nr:MAG: nucleotide sugar dehydrogenase [Parcubacteria group bacterium Gr01-1014_31]